jgi:hypothetical protein
VVKTPWCSIIIPTLSDNPPTLKSLPPPEELERLGIELIVSKDMGWRNASRTRNMGAMKARGEVLCFIDDELHWIFGDFSQSFVVSRVMIGFNIYHDQPHLLVINARLFKEVGGYDERYKPQMGEDFELKLRLRHKGL